MPKLIQTWFSLRELLILCAFTFFIGIIIGQAYRIKQIEPTLDKEIEYIRQSEDRNRKSLAALELRILNMERKVNYKWK